MHFEELPVELIAEILGELDLQSLITMSHVSKRLYLVASDSALNPWRKPILANLQSHPYEAALKHLSVRMTVPRQNWIEILSLARPSFLLYEATLPNLKATEWEECFQRRFLPGWAKWKKDGSWKEVFLKMLYRIVHRGSTSCTADEAWTKYIVLNRNGSANELEISSRNFNPINIFNEIKLQNNLAHLETRIRLVVEFKDVRILAFGTMTKPRSQTSVNANAHLLLNPPGIDPSRVVGDMESTVVVHGNAVIDDHGVYPSISDPLTPSSPTQPSAAYPSSYTRIRRPLPAATHAKYPFYTPGGGDIRWKDSDEINGQGGRWVGSMMITTQLLGPIAEGDATMPGRQYASFTWADLWIIAPWLEDIITTRVDGPGLGH
ncbi:hypothetical protein CC1G_01344 [Coprinopsis cinerea okayama7|uniref:F-box domain-containing protein n=1 Tax=Coprinopsis cinerea (strain Okayama-7 / 130 / ATCC MYA-4618 / FGSC 9003) TaxID=240176 RepID=A8NYH8_COPC7|nr:hypothetical protein CC1G_01344 [Coprinopsis cinerea okayama7\|eukprot:XP_001837432.1 hypothetical protein CC1G_01344 [Coprinopsis cinerea okayama7\